MEHRGVQIDHRSFIQTLSQTTSCWWLPPLLPILREGLFLSFASSVQVPPFMAAADLINIISVCIKASSFGSSGGYLLPPQCTSRPCRCTNGFQNGDISPNQTNRVSLFGVLVYFLFYFDSLTSSSFPALDNFPYTSHLCLVVSPTLLCI